MYSRRIFSLTGAALTVASIAVIPAAASTGTLLSGYGGPGQGNQHILGSALVGGSAGGGGSSSGGGAAGSGSREVPGGSSAAGETRTGGSGHSRRSSARTGARGGRVAHATPSSTRPYPISTGLARSVSGDSRTLGLSGRDVLFILLGLGALALTAVLTWQLARIQSGREDGAAKGIRRQNRGTE